MKDLVKGGTRRTGRVLRAIGHEIAETIRFGAVPASVVPRGMNENVNAPGVVAGLGGLEKAERDVEDAERD